MESNIESLKNIHLQKRIKELEDQNKELLCTAQKEKQASKMVQQLRMENAELYTKVNLLEHQLTIKETQISSLNEIEQIDVQLYEQKIKKQKEIIKQLEFDVSLKQEELEIIQNYVVGEYFEQDSKSVQMYLDAKRKSDGQSMVIMEHLRSCTEEQFLEAGKTNEIINPTARACKELLKLHCVNQDFYQKVVESDDLNCAAIWRSNLFDFNEISVRIQTKTGNMEYIEPWKQRGQRLCRERESMFVTNKVLSQQIQQPKSTKDALALTIHYLLRKNARLLSEKTTHYN